VGGCDRPADEPLWYNRRDLSGAIRCPSTNTFATTAKPILRRSCSTRRRKSPARVALGRRTQSNCRCLAPRMDRATVLRRNLRPRSPVAGAVVAAGVAAATSCSGHRLWRASRRVDPGRLFGGGKSGITRVGCLCSRISRIEWPERFPIRRGSRFDGGMNL
jgi:hypothetical protein